MDFSCACLGKFSDYMCIYILFNKIVEQKMRVFPGYGNEQPAGCLCVIEDYFLIIGKIFGVIDKGGGIIIVVFCSCRDHIFLGQFFRVGKDRYFFIPDGGVCFTGAGHLTEMTQ